MVVDAILERNPEVAFKSAIDMDRVSCCQQQISDGLSDKCVLVCMCAVKYLLLLKEFREAITFRSLGSWFQRLLPLYFTDLEP